MANLTPVIRAYIQDEIAEFDNEISNADNPNLTRWIIQQVADSFATLDAHCLAYNLDFHEAFMDYYAKLSDLTISHKDPAYQ